MMKTHKEKDSVDRTPSAYRSPLQMNFLPNATFIHICIRCACSLSVLLKLLSYCWHDFTC